jgi:hypothetical protein
MLEVCKFVLYNIVTIFLLSYFGDCYEIRFWIIYVIVAFVVLNLTIKTIISSIYLIKHKINLYFYNESSNGEMKD